MLSGRYDFLDGGYYCGQYFDGLIEGYGVCISPRGQGEFSGKWARGFETSGVYKWPSGKTYEGCWSENKKHGLGIETKDKWVYKGEWTRGLIGRYGCKCSQTSSACYEGTWSAGLVDGYGVEVSADGGIYRGQWFKGMRHGHGVRISVPYYQATHYRQSKSSTFQQSKSLKSSLSSIQSDFDDSNAMRDSKSDLERAGFVLRGLRPNNESDSSNLSGNITPETSRKTTFQKKIGSNFKRTLAKKFGKYKKSEKGDSSRSLPPSTSGSPVRFTSGSVRSLISADSSKSTMTNRTGSQGSFMTDSQDGNLIETYSGEWKSDKRCGYGIALRSDGLKYAGEWYNNKRNGYGATTFESGVVEEGKYKNNILVAALTSKKASIFAIRSARLRDQVDCAVSEAEKASQIAFQKTEVAVSRMNVARAKAEMATEAAEQARIDSQIAFQISNKSWGNIIKDSDLADSIQLRHSQAESNGLKDHSTKEPIGSSLIKHVLNSSLRKSFRLSQRSNKHSEKSEETHNERETDNYDETEILSNPQQTNEKSPNHSSVLQQNDVAVKQEDIQYSSLESEAYGLARPVAFNRPSIALKRNKSQQSKVVPATLPPLKTFPLKPEALVKPQPCQTTSKTKETLSWCLLMFFNVVMAVSILVLLHKILV